MIALLLLIAADWKPLEPENTLYLELPQGRVIIALAPAFAPKTVANIKTLVREGYFEGSAILRAQDNYVVQWGQPDEKKPFGSVKATLAPEFSVPRAGPFTRLPDGDVYAPEVGFADLFPVARDDKQMWLAHCYGMVGVGRDESADTGNGSSLYTVIGHAPRHLDRNVTVVGRVVKGIELLSVMTRGKEAMGFYTPAQNVPIQRTRIAADVPTKERTNVEFLASDTAEFTKVIEARRNRTEAWYKHKAGKVELCNVPLSVRYTP